MAAELLKLTVSHHPNLHSSASRYRLACTHRRHSGSFVLHSSNRLVLTFSTNRRISYLTVSKAVEIDAPIDNPVPEQEYTPADSSILLHVTGMMCGACVSRVKGIISADQRVESAVVNMLTETAAIRVKPGVLTLVDDVAESLAKRLTECGFETKRRKSGKGVGERVRMWKEKVAKKEELMKKSRNRVVLAWTLVALCCGSHASHILHSLGIHVAHGGLWDVLHNSYVKGALALGALLGPGRDLLYNGLRAFAKGTPNMNSLVGFGSIAAFIISSISLLNPGLDWDASFFDEPTMLTSSMSAPSPKIFGHLSILHLAEEMRSNSGSLRCMCWQKMLNNLHGRKIRSELSMLL